MGLGSHNHGNPIPKFKFDEAISTSNFVQRLRIELTDDESPQNGICSDFSILTQRGRDHGFQFQDEFFILNFELWLRYAL